MHHDRRWYSHKPNYYFPKIDQYPDLKTATGIFIVSTMGIFGVLSGWMVILYRMGVRARHQRELQSHLQTISELLDRQDEERTPDEPPSYEAPPDYEEVIKVGMQQELREPRRQRRRQRGRDRACSRAPSNCTVQSMVPVHRSCSLDRERDQEQPSTSAAAMTRATDAAQDATQTPQQLAQRMLLATAICGKRFGYSPICQSPPCPRHLLIYPTESHLQTLQARLARRAAPAQARSNPWGMQRARHRYPLGVNYPQPLERQARPTARRTTAPTPFETIHSIYHSL